MQECERERHQILNDRALAELVDLDRLKGNGALPECADDGHQMAACPDKYADSTAALAIDQGQDAIGFTGISISNKCVHRDVVGRGFAGALRYRGTVCDD